MRRWILILSMLRIKGAVLLLYTALIFYSEIEIAYFYLGLSFCDCRMHIILFIEEKSIETLLDSCSFGQRV